MSEQPVAGTNRQLGTEDLIRRGIVSAVNSIVEQCHDRSVDAGWWKTKQGANMLAPGFDPEFKKNIMGTKVALIHSEVSEALEGYRKDKADEHLPHRKSVEVELADAVIRICDMAGALGLDLGGAIAEKLAYNAIRADHKPEARAAVGGKAF